MPKLKKEQEQVIAHNDGNILVSASAGSGKTFAMIKRLVRLVSEGKAKVTEIMAVTFTEASALDMKNKLREALIKQINDGETHLAKQLNDVPLADISTIHSFASRIIRSYFYVAGVAPDFKVCDSEQAEIYKNESLEKTFNTLYENKDQKFLKLVDRFAKKRSDREFKEVILKLYEKTQNEVNRRVFFDKCNNIYTKEGHDSLVQELSLPLERIPEFIEKAQESLQYFESQKINAYSKYTASYIEALCNLQGKDLYYLLENSQFFKERLPGGKQGDENATPYKDQVKEGVAVIRELIELGKSCLTTYEQDLIRNEQLKDTTSTILQVIEKFNEEYSRTKMEENVLDFNDLEHYLLKILSDDVALANIRKKYKYVFVDEYQDVNPVQEEIITKISNDNLFMVGDAKQSIYGFRGCRPEIFEKKYADMARREENVVRLNYNFRCAENIIEFVNTIFSYCMTEKVYGTSYFDTSKLIAGGIYDEEHKGRATFHIIPKQEKENEKATPRIYDILEEAKKPAHDQANAVAQYVATIIGQEIKDFYYEPCDEGKMIGKRIGFNDIAILTRNRDNKYVSSLVSGLIRRGVPVSSSVEQNICDYPEVSLMINLLKLVDCASLNIPLAVVLKSPIGNFTEEDLAQMVLHYKDDKGYGEFYQAYRYALVSDNPLKERLVAFDEYLKDLRFRADFIGAKGVLEKACEDAYIIERLLASRQGKNKVKRLRRFISLTENEGGSLTVSEMLNKIERNEKAFTLNESAENETVKVMTIHSSKGLEFPVVIVCGTEKEMSTKDNTQEILFDKDFGLAVKYYNDKDRIFSSTALREVIKKKNLVTFMKEEMRLFYVALTRAKYALHVTYEGEERLRDDIFSKASKFIHYLPNTILPRTLEPDELMEDQRETRKVIIGNTDENLIDKMKKDFSFVYDYQGDTTIPLKTNVTAINLAKEFSFNSNDKNATNVFVNLEEILDGQKPANTSPANTSKEIGTIAHKILENFDFNGEDLKTQTNALIESGILTCEEVSQVDLDRLFYALQSDAFKDISKKSIYREQSFLINIPANMIYDTLSNEQVLVQGIIDLLVVDNDSAQIIDYKYSRSDGEHLKERYKKQLDLYAFATEKILGKKVSKKTLVNIYSGEVLSID